MEVKSGNSTNKTGAETYCPGTNNITQKIESLNKSQLICVTL